MQAKCFFDPERRLVMLPILRQHFSRPVRVYRDPLVSVWGDVDRLFAGLFHSPERAESYVEPEFHVAEDDQKVTLQAEIPGVPAADIHVEVREGTLSISGERNDEPDGKEDAGPRWMTRRYGSFARTFSLPSHINADAIEASYKDGVLTVTLPKSEEAKPKTIEVKGA